MLNYTLDYLTNGNISSQYITGSYRSNFTDIKYIRSNFTYDNSNRLKKVERYNTKYFDLAGDYSYDPDGNFASLTRSYNSDNFTYDYYTGTNRLKKVTGLTDQYTYDYNGNMTSDINNFNYNIKYDHRNLIYEMMNTLPLSFTFLYRYKYDEAGNRTRKMIYRTDIQPPPPINENSDNPGSGWITMKDEYYSRDASGKEIAVYQSSALDYWNVWGTGNEGRIKSTGMKYFYLKDHLGSIRAVINQNNVIVEALDYDPWGHIARFWDTTSTDYKFTGKERDQESNYDYFGARYYDARIGRWGGVEPLLDNNLQYSPYCYARNNPKVMVDPTGRDVIYIYFVSYRINTSGVSVPYINHAGVLLIDNKSGEVSYYQFGRYGKDNKGLVQGVGLKPIGVENGKLNENEISDRLIYISKKYGKGSEIEGAYIQSDKYEEMKQYADDKMEETKENSEDTYDILTNNCATFSSDVIQRDNNITPPILKLVLPKQYSIFYRLSHSKINYNKDENKYEINK
jgi:RHS repeat-associated protein